MLLNHYDYPEYFTVSFPTLFWKGTGGHSDKREPAISLKLWIRYLLQHHSRRFAQHPTFIFLAYNLLQRMDASLGSKIITSNSNWLNLQQISGELNSSDFEQIEREVCTHGYIKHKNLAQILRTVHLIGAHIPNSYEHRISMRRQMQGIVARYGQPTIWFTLNPNDLSSPILLRLAGVDIDIMNFNSSSYSSSFRLSIACKNPVAATQYFHYTVNAFFQDLVKDATTHPGIFGPVKAHFAVDEINARGMLHPHGLLWLHGNSAVDTLAAESVLSESFKMRLIQYYDKVIHESICDSLVETE